ncbi:MAG: CAF17-like 4Fe-4S cluster assembly/insertion protein YgfZ [Candidatus Nanopelagicales bacterium]
MTAVPMMRNDDVDAGVPWHYGDPFAEQRLLAAGAGAVDLSHRGVLEIKGADRLSWLDSLTSQLLLGLQPGDATYDLLLDPHGRVEAELHVAVLEDRLLVGVEPGNAGTVLAFLERMRFMLRVEVRDVTEQWATVWEPVRAAHPRFASVLTPALYAGLPLPDAGADVTNYVAPQTEHFAGRELFVPRAELKAYLATHPALAGSWAWNALRIAAGLPRFGVETDERTIPHEVGWLGSAVHMKKGCYRGQETVAKVHNAGKPPRRLVLLHLDGSRDDLPQHGVPVMAGEEQVGFLGMSAHHHELGPIATALVKRALDPARELTVAGLQAAQQLIVNQETAGTVRGSAGKVRMRMLGHA